MRLFLVATLALYAAGAHAEDTDIVVVVATSSGTTVADFNGQGKAFLKKFADKISSGSSVGIVAYEALSTVRIGYDACSSRDCLKTKIDHLPAPYGIRCTGDAIAEATKMLAASKRKPTMVVVTDGPEDCPDKTKSAGEQADEARKKGIDVIGVAVGKGLDKNDDMKKELEAIGGKDNKGRGTAKDNYGDLDVDDLVNKVNNKPTPRANCADTAGAGCQASYCAVGGIFESMARLHCEETCGYCTKPRGENCKDLIDKKKTPCDDQAECVYKGEQYNPPYQCWCGNKFRKDAYAHGFKENPCQANQFMLRHLDEQTKRTPCNPANFDYISKTVQPCNDYLQQKKLSDKLRCDEPEFHTEGSILCRASAETQAYFYAQKADGSERSATVLPDSSEKLVNNKGQMLIQWTARDSFYCHKNAIWWTPTPPPKGEADLYAVKGMACIVDKALGDPKGAEIITTSSSTTTTTTTTRPTTTTTTTRPPPPTTTRPTPPPVTQPRMCPCQKTEPWPCPFNSEHPNCVNFIRNGFCTNFAYDEAKIRGTCCTGCHKNVRTVASSCPCG